MIISWIILAWDTNDWLIIVLLVLAVVIGFSYQYLSDPKRQLLKALKQSPAKDTYNVKEGEYVRLHGTVLPNEDLLKAPFSGRACVLYKAEVWEQTGNDDVLFKEDFRHQQFTLRSGGEIVKVCPVSRHMINHLIDVDMKSLSRPHSFPKENLKKFKELHKLDDRTWLWKNEKKLYYYEAVIAPGERIAVKGIAKWTTDPETNKRQLELHGTYEQKLLISDDPKTLRILPK